MGGYRKNVLLLCEYQAIYGGNFVPSLVALEEALRKYGYGVVYVFPNGALERPWLQQLKGQGRTVETISFKVDNMAFVRSVSTLAERYDVDDAKINVQYFQKHMPSSWRFINRGGR